MGIKDIPLWVRKAIVDAIEGAVVAVAGLSFVVPGSLTEAKAQALVIFAAVAGATIAAFRRAVLDHFLANLRNRVVGDETEEPTPGN